MALDVPEAAREALPAPPPQFRALPPQSLHVTLAFLGWRSRDDVERAAGVLDPPRPGVLSFDGVVLLPPRRPRVMAVRLADPSGACRHCQAAVSASLAEAGLYEPEKRPWLPHVTIGRSREPVARATPLPPLAGFSFEPAAVTLYESTLSRGGAVYEPLRRWPA